MYNSIDISAYFENGAVDDPLRIRFQAGLRYNISIEVDFQDVLARVTASGAPSTWCHELSGFIAHFTSSRCQNLPGLIVLSFQSELCLLLVLVRPEAKVVAVPGLFELQLG